MTARPALTDVEALDRAVFALEVASGVADPGAAINAVRLTTTDLDATDLRRVLACLAVRAARAMPSADVVRWLDTLRLEHLVSLELVSDDQR